MNNQNSQVNWEKWNFFVEFFTLMGIVYGAFLSFFCPIIGIVLGIVFLSGGTEKIKRIGKLYLILGIVSIIIGIIITIIFIFLSRYYPFWERFGYLT